MGVNREPVPSGFLTRVITIAAVVTTVAALAWSFDVAARLALPVYLEQFTGLMLGLALFMAFAGVAERSRAAWAVVASAAGLVVGGWIALRYPALQADVIGNRTEAIVLACATLVLVVEACRRSAGWALAAVFGVFFVYALFGHLMPGILETKRVSLERLLPYLALDTSSLLGQVMAIACTTVIAFMFFGRLLQSCGGGEFFTDISTALFGRYRGGSGKVEVVASGLFGTISGSAVANVMSTGIITIPNMKKAGYRPETAGAVEAVSSTGGQIMPPVMGAAAFLMAENLQVRYAEVAIAAIVPALLFYISVFVQIDFEAARRRIGGLDPATLPRASGIFRAGWFFVIPFAVLFYLMFAHNMQAEEAVLYGAAAMVPFAVLKGYGGRKLTFRGFLDALADTGRDAVEIVVICAIAGVVIGLLNITGLSMGLSLSLVKLGEGSLPLLLVVVALICIVLGMGLPTTGVYLLVAILAAPPLVQLGVPPMAAHMFVFLFGCLSMITPPVAMAAYAAAHIAKADPIQVALTACRLGWPAFVVPFLFAYSPALLLIGSWPDIVIAVASAVAGTWLLCAAIAGYLFRELAGSMRAVVAAAGLLLLVPAHSFPGAIFLDIAGAALAAWIVTAEIRRARLAYPADPVA